MMLLLAIVLSAASPAPSCPEGKTVSPDTAGNCCWPQQVWSRARSVCVGLPACPAGLKAQGESCVVSCPHGQEVGPDTAGACCWPQQVWSAGRRQCVGIPSCPAGWKVRGEGCEVDAAPPPSPPAAPPVVAAEPPGQPPPPPPTVPPADAPRAVAPPTPAPTLAPHAAAGEDGAPPGFHYEKRRLKGLVISGAVLLGVGYFIALAVGFGGYAWYLAYPENKCWQHVATYSWIPLLGPIISIEGQKTLSRGRNGDLPCTGEPLYPLGTAVAAVDTVMQFAGLGLLITGLAVRRDELVPNATSAAPRDQPEWYVNLGAPGSSLGLTVGLRNW